MKNEKQNEAKTKIRFASRLAPKKNQADDDVGVPVVSELKTRLPVVVALGRSHHFD